MNKLIQKNFFIEKGLYAARITVTLWALDHIQQEFCIYSNTETKGDRTKLLK